MSVVESLVRMAWPKIENPNVPLSSDNLLAAIGGGVSASGQRVGVDDALQYSPVWCAVDIISSSIARIPWITYQRYEKDGREHRRKARDHEVFYLLRHATSRSQSAKGRLTSNVFIAKLLASALLYRAGYAIIHRSGRQITSLEWIPSWRVKPQKVKNGRVVYECVVDHEGNVEHVYKENMFVVHGLSISELGGMSIIDYARNTIGRQLSMEQYEDDFYKNHAVPKGFFTHPGEMGTDAQERFIANIVRKHGRGNWHTFGILEEGMTWKESGISPKDALLLDGLRFGVPEISRYYRVPLHMLADPSRQGWNTTEAENNSFLNLCLGNWISRLEFEASDTLFGPPNRLDVDEYYTEFLVDSILKANTKDRFGAYAMGIQWGFLSRNEVRAKENLDPYEGGDDFLTPMNHDVGASEDEDDDNNDNEGGDTDTDDDARSFADQMVQKARRGVIADQLVRMAKRISGAATRAAGKPDSFLRFVNRIGELHGTAIREAMSPSVALSAAIRGEESDAIADDLVDKMIATAVDTYERACECQPDQLEISVRSAGDSLAELFEGFSDDLLKGKSDDHST